MSLSEEQIKKIAEGIRFAIKNDCPDGLENILNHLNNEIKKLEKEKK